MTTFATPAATGVRVTTDNPGLSNKLGLWFAHAYVIGMCATLLGAYTFQFGLWEYPCPMCLLQRMFFLLSAIGPTYIIMRSRTGVVTTREFASGWGWAVMAAILGSFVSGAQVLMHIAPNDPGYAGALLGLHLYTWAFITFVMAVLAAGIVLFLSAFSEPGRVAATSTALRRAAKVTPMVLVAFAATNLVACFFLQGLHWKMTGDPTGYQFFTDLGW
ncbi:disulfide bond formation protein B [Nocardia sp. CDC160]|uniref:disulfide bond formation protein B n=1 Tax=Nocardia sp. CDC160 TaxID=3112166 RepID=UPI002DC03904|nr:disulfide bond formation protein B [Nocardia sp. CDC160]MEC3920539.1 disulfide bond formation protein B [Nocardia sp. CDC160]